MIYYNEVLEDLRYKTKKLEDRLEVVRNEIQTMQYEKNILEIKIRYANDSINALLMFNNA